MDDLFPPSPFPLGSGQSYYERSDGLWAARIQLPGHSPEYLLAASEPALRAAVVAGLRAWAASAGVDALGDLLEALGQPRGARATATRRSACEAALAWVESGAWLEVTP
jgi:hypothetical protein